MELHFIEGKDGYYLTAYDPEVSDALEALDRSYKKYREVYRELAK